MALVFVHLCSFHPVLFLVHRQEIEVCKCSDLYEKESNSIFHANMLVAQRVLTVTNRLT
jgi:hypothetical protein